MKLKKYLISFITIFTFLFADVVFAAATAPKSFIIKATDMSNIDVSNYLPGNQYHFFYKKNTNGDIIYCIESHDDIVASGQHTYTLGKELDAKYAYVIANGYPNKKITGDNKKDYFITAYAIFYLVNPNDYLFNYMDFSAGTYRGKSNTAVKEIAKLVNGAKNYSYTNPTIKLDTSNNNFALSNDTKYYTSSSIGVTTTGNVGNYTVSLENAPTGTIIVDTNGNEKSTFTTSEKFIIKTPASSITQLSNNFKVNVSTTGSTDKAYRYNPSNSSYQSVAVLYSENITVSDSATLNLNLTTEVQISKVDVTTGGELPGATLTVKDANGNVKDTWVSTTEVHVIKGLEPGKYTLTEEIAPEGYILSTETITFEVKADGTVTKVVMENKPEEKTIVPIYISKQDITTSEEVAGAHLELKDADGNIIEDWVSTTERHVIEKGLKPGKYYLTETLAPTGYELSTETVEFTVKEDGTVDGDIIMYNKPEKKVVSIYISKQDITTGEEVAGAHLELKDANGNIIEAWVSTTERHIIDEGLKPGKYYLTETLAPMGYELSTETIEFTVKEDGTVDGDIIMYNKPETIIEVPSTSSFKTITSSLIGIIIIGLGYMIIYKNYKKNEEY